MITTEDINIIDKFINEELSPIELRKFQERISVDMEFSKEVRIQISAVKGVRAYAALQFMADIKSKIPTWKEDGYKSYAPSVVGSKTILRIIIPLIILGVGYWIFTMVQGNQPGKPIPKKELPADTLPQKSPPKDTAKLEVLLLKADDDSTDISFEIKDITSFGVEQIADSGTFYYYALRYDGKTDTIKSKLDNVVELLNQQASALQNDSTDIQNDSTTIPIDTSDDQ